MRGFARVAYTIFAWIFVLGVAVQVFLVGLVVIAGQMGWEPHVGLGHSLGLPLILMLVSMYVGGLGKRVKRMTWLLFGVYLFQADILIFLRGSVPSAAALHPVIALVDFYLGLVLATKALELLRAPSTSAKPAPVVGEAASD